jgi:HTH-type transcriptional regulator/antitoxin HigA
MPEINQVHSEAEYDAALARVSELLDAEMNTPEGEELDRISNLIIQYEDEHYPMEDPDPNSLLGFLLDQEIVTREQLIPLAGGDAHLDAILSGRRGIAPELAQFLHERSGIPVEDLVKTSVHHASTAASD